MKEVENKVVPWIDEKSESGQTQRRKAQVFTLKSKRCKVCGKSMKGSYVFTGDKKDFLQPEYFPRMAMHLGCAMKLNEQERHEVVARNELYIEPLANGYRIGRWVEYWRFALIKGKWQTLTGGHTKQFGEWLLES